MPTDHRSPRAPRVAAALAMLAFGCDPSPRDGAPPAPQPMTAQTPTQTPHQAPSEVPVATAPTAPTEGSGQAPAEPTADAPTPGAQAPQPMTAEAARPLHYERPLQPADLEGRSLRELALMRNTLYARKGQPFRKRWLREHFEAQPWYKAGERVTSDALSELERKNVQAIVEAELALSRAELQRRFDALQARAGQGKAEEHDALELKLLATRLGVAAPAQAARQGQGGDAARSPFDDPALLDKQLTVEQLSDLSLRDLRLLRNMIYARRGRGFKSNILTDYFEHTSWYKPDPAYSQSKLTPVDGRNIRLIRSVEDSLGGPLSDHGHMLEEGWLGEA